MTDETDQPRDVLAAEEFAVPAPDPVLGVDGVHDVLAAEEFVLPAPDPNLTVTSRPLELPADPQDPTGAGPAHDVLAAEEFALPAGQLPPKAARTNGFGHSRLRGRIIPALAVAAGIVLLRRLADRR